MIFKPEMVEKILEGRKTVTRRPVKPGNSLHGEDWRACRYEVGKTYAVQPGRGKKGVARIKVQSITRGPTQPHTIGMRCLEARLEGFGDWHDFRDYWIELYGSYDPTQLVDRIEFELVKTTPERDA